MEFVEYIKTIEIDSLWSGRKHIVWNLDRHINILSGVNGVGKSTILNKVLKSLKDNGGVNGGALPDVADGVHLETVPASAKHIRYDVVRSFDKPLVSADMATGIDFRLVTELDLQLFNLQRRYLDYQVNLGNRIIQLLQSGQPDAAAKAQQLSENKKHFQDIVDSLFADTGKTIIRTENEIRFLQMDETLTPYQLSSGEKQMLVILLTVLVEDNQPYVLFMDEPEVSLHIDWQKRLIDNIIQLNPNVQLILTTHSPAVIMDGWLDNVTEVSEITIL